MVMNFVECEIQWEHPFEEPVEKPYKDYAEFVGFKEKTSSSATTVADSTLSDDYKRTSNKFEDSKPNIFLIKRIGTRPNLNCRTRTRYSILV